MTVAEFDAYPATVRTLRQFCKAVTDLDSQVGTSSCPTRMRERLSDILLNFQIDSERIIL